LLREFGSLQRIQEASPEELRRVEPLTQKDIRTVLGFFHPREEMNWDADFRR
jgi:excinuclease UvrABC nuclease subunit